MHKSLAFLDTTRANSTASYKCLDKLNDCDCSTRLRVPRRVKNPLKNDVHFHLHTRKSDSAHDTAHYRTVFEAENEAEPEVQRPLQTPRLSVHFVHSSAFLGIEPPKAAPAVGFLLPLSFLPIGRHP